jgi:hypothetical protein
VVGQVSKLNSHLTKILGWASKVPGSGVTTAKAFFEKYAKPIDDKIQLAINVGDILTDWANIGSPNAQALQAAAAFRVGIKTINLGMTFVKAVPLFGELWSKFYAPALEASLVVARKLYLEDGYSSMYAYCMGELRMSDDIACKRIRAAKAARRFPALLVGLTEGKLHLSGVALLAPHLTEATAAELLRAPISAWTWRRCTSARRFDW